jgi:hypothetical protein
MNRDNANEGGISKIKEILLEPDFGQMLSRLGNIENKLAQNADLTAVNELKKEVEGLKNDFAVMRTEINELKEVLVGFNRKITGAFSAFVKGPA